MSVPAGFGEQVVRVRRVQDGADRYGNPVYVDEETVLAERAGFAPEQASSEPVAVGREAVIVKPSLYFPGQWPDITEDDQVRVRGVLYDVEGVPADWRDPWTGDGGLVVTLKVVKG